MYYEDEISKLKYLRNRISGTLVKNGLLPDRSIIDNRLDAIDAKLSLFQHTNVQESTKLNVATLNTELISIYEDLSILYQLVYDFSAKKLEDTRAYVEMHLAELEALASRYEQKTRLETESTSIGDTILFKNSGFDIKTRDCVTTINLGKIKPDMGSRISFYIKGKGFKDKDVTFILNKDECAPYSINGDYLVVPGEAKYNEYSYSLPENLNQIDDTAIAAQGLKPNIDYNYIIYGGKNEVQVKEKYTSKIVNKEQSSPVTLRSDGRVSFYVIDGSYINFEFSKQPKSKNFTGYVINNLSKEHKITFEYRAPFSFNYVTDGTVYAVKKNGIVKDGMLFYPDSANVKEFLVKEYTGKNKKELPLSVTIQQTTNETPTVSMVAVKELAVFDEEEAG